MPSPVGHSLIGLALGLAWRLPRVPDGRALARQIWEQRGWLVFCVVLANAPDIDVLFGMARGNLNAFHQAATHTLVWAAAVALCVWLAARQRRGLSARDFLFILALTSSHLIADLLCEDHSPPRGIMLAWPLSESYWHSPISLFPAVAKAGWSDLWSRHNAGAAAAEGLLLLPVLAAVLWWKLRKRPSRAKSQSPPSKP